jgi:AcrR family transcriptional regulator
MKASQQRDRSAGTSSGRPIGKSTENVRAQTSRATSAQRKDRRLRAALQGQPPEVQQDRAKRSYEALLDAGERLFARDGYDEVGTPQIAAEAGVAVGTLYRYFDDKKAVYLAIVRRYLLRAYHETIDPLTPERFAGKARRETLEETVRILFEHVERQPRLNRVFLEMSLRDADVAKLRLDFEAAAVQRLAQLVAMVCPRQEIGDPEATAWVLHAAALECATGLTGVGRPTQISAARVRKALTEVIERTLFPTR